jgi:excisionase family DNA binding protein
MPSSENASEAAEQKTRRMAPPIAPITVRIPEACRMIGIGRSKMYELIQEGRVETVKLGTSTLVVVESLASLIAGIRQEQRNGRVQF